jgi:hypothetical protein
MTVTIWPLRTTSASGHLGDDELAVIALAGPDGAGEAAATHVLGCPTCSERLLAVGRLLDDTRDAAIAEADRLFPAARLDRQRASILRRIAGSKGAARILPFPSHGTVAPVRHHRARRYVAAAAVAGLLIGAVAGRFFYLPQQPLTRAARAPIGSAEPTAAVATAQVSLVGDEAFLSDFEAALGGPRVAPLQALDAMTPRVADERAR